MSHEGGCAFEYRLACWKSSEHPPAFEARLTGLGAEGWEAVGISPRSMNVPMPGMCPWP